jgi:hypothetical protein
MCLLGYKLIFAWWAHIALRAEWQPGTQALHRERRVMNPLVHATSLGLDGN